MDLSPSDTEDEIAYYMNPTAPENHYMSRPHKVTSTADRDTHDNRLFENQHQTTSPHLPAIHNQADNPLDYVKKQKHSFNWDGQTLSIKERSQIQEPPRPPAPKKSIPEENILTDNPWEFLEIHALSLKDRNLIIKPTQTQPEPSPIYIEIASLNTKSRRPEIPYIHLGLSAPNGKHSPVMLRAMHDSGCAKSVMRKEIFASIPGYKDIPVNK